MDINQTKKGLHWGHGIIFTFMLFGAFMAYFYIHMSHEKIELVGENYYADGQAYQKKINLQNQAIPQEHQISVQRIAKDDFLLIQLPNDCSDRLMRRLIKRLAGKRHWVKYGRCQRTFWFPAHGKEQLPGR